MVVLDGLILEGDLVLGLDLFFLSISLSRNFLILVSLHLLLLVSHKLNLTVVWFDAAAALCSHF